MPKNFRRIPPEILLRLERFALDDVVAACAKRIQAGDVDKCSHLGLRFVDGALITPPPAVPSAQAGKYSTYNVEGKDIVRKDLPKTTKTFSFFAPSWGSGTHLVSQVRDVYQREFIPPKEVELSVTLLEKQGDAWILKFAIDQVISRRAPDFESDLLYNLNILQENVAAADVFESTATFEDYAATIRVDWELLPAGQIGPKELAERLIARGKAPTELEKSTILSRLQTFEKLKPTHFISGTSGFSRYFGAKYGDDFVVFENIRYGNAMYVMFEDWQTLSQKSRIDLLKGDREGFERIEHRDDWEDRLEAMLEHHRKETRRRQR